MSLSLNYLSDQMQEPYQQMEDNTLLACLFWDITLEWGGGCRKRTVSKSVHIMRVMLVCPVVVI